MPGIEQFGRVRAEQVRVDTPGYGNQQELDDELLEGGAGGFKTDVPVSLSNGKMLGKYPSGSTIPAAGKSVAQVLRDIATESIYPTYQPAGLGLNQSLPTVGEVGEKLTNVLTATFYRNDAGLCLGVKIKRDGQLLTASTSSLARVDNTVQRTLAGTTYQATADYQAGPAKPVAPAGTPDERAPQVQQGDAPQAAQNGLLSGVQRVLGCYRYFWGPVATVPASSAQVRALANSCLSLQQPATAILTTGNSVSTFAVALPVGVSLTSVVDINALGAVLTSEYHPEPIQVEDAAGELVAYQLYVMRAAVPYADSHQHQLLFSA